jgi:8-oxo-dGTP diphosphatase
MSERPFGMTVRAVVRDAEGRCLLIRRSAANKSFVGQWEWPGGKVDPGEDFVTALHRELAEETGLTVALTGFAGATSFDMPQTHVVVLCMDAAQTAGEIRLSEEHDAAEWVSLADLVNWKLPEHMRDFMLQYAERKVRQE